MEEKYTLEELMEVPIIIEVFPRSKPDYINTICDGTERKKFEKMNIKQCVDYVLENYEKDQITNLVKREIETVIETSTIPTYRIFDELIIGQELDEEGNVLDNQSITQPINNKNFLKYKEDENGTKILYSNIKVNDMANNLNGAKYE